MEQQNINNLSSGVLELENLAKNNRSADLIKEDTSKEEYDDDDGEEETPPAKSIRLIYLEKLFLLFKAIFIVADHVTDIILIVTLFEMKQRWFGSIYLAVDVFPAAIIMWSKYRSEKSWKVLRFWCHPYNVVKWTILTFRNYKHSKTLEDIKASHLAIEAPFQVLLKLSMVFLGILPLPGTEEAVIENELGIKVDLSWFSIISSFFSILGMLSGALWITAPTEEVTNGFTSKLIFIPLFFYRMMAWLMIITFLHSFSFLVLGGLAMLNVGVLLISQKNKINVEPIVQSMLSLAFPVTSLPSAEIDKGISLRLFFWLVFTGNIYFLLVLGILYTLYYVETYNPWCSKVWHKFLIPEKVMNNFHYCSIALFTGATLPVTLTFVLKNFRYKTLKTVAVAITAFIFTVLSLILIFVSLFGHNSHPIAPIRYVSINQTRSGWGTWTINNGRNVRYRTCFNHSSIQFNSMTNFDSEDVFGNQWLNFTNCVDNCQTNRISQGPEINILKCNSECLGETILSSKSAKETSNSKPTMTKLLVVDLKGGKSNGSTFEIINLDEENPNIICDDLPAFPNTVWRSTGQLIHNTPVICAQEDGNDCKCQAFQNGSWAPTSDSPRCINFAASAILTKSDKKDVLFISGGAPLYSTDLFQSTVTFNGTTWETKNTTDLPKGVMGHCIVKINSTTLFSIGGAQEKEYTSNNRLFDVKNTYFYNAEINKWTPGPNLTVARKSLSCGLLKWNNPESNLLEKIVVASGGFSNSIDQTSVELLYLNEEDVSQGEWVMGPPMPVSAPYSTMVEYNNSVILIGGVDRRHLYKLSSPTDDWIEMRQTLKYKSTKHVSFLVPDEILNCHRKGFTKLLVASGSAYESKNNVEIINLDNEDLVCDDLPDLPFGAEGATGQLIAGETPVICGGHPNLCGCQVFKNGFWSNNENKLQCRQFAASGILTNAEAESVLIITGGYYGKQLNTIETFDGTTRKSQLNDFLPEPVYEHCIIQVDSSTLISIGGKTDSNYVGKTYLFNAKVNKWTLGSSLNIPRSGFSCGILKWQNPDTNNLENILVVAGGYDENGISSSVELAFLNNNTFVWEKGPSLPKPIAEGTMIAFESSVILIGGNQEIDDEDNGHFLYQLSSPDGNWTEMRQKTKLKRAKHVAFLVPDDIVDCHKTRQVIQDEIQNEENNN